MCRYCFTHNPFPLGGYSNQSAVALKSLSATSEVGVVGVVGALLPAALLTELLENAGMEAEQDDVIYLVDSSGYVVASTEQVLLYMMFVFLEQQAY